MWKYFQNTWDLIEVTKKAIDNLFQVKFIEALLIPAFIKIKLK